MLNLPCFLFLYVSSLPVVADLMETCIDDVLRAPVVPAVTAIEEPVQAAAYAGASVPAEDVLSLAGKAAANWPIFKNLP